MSTVVYIGNAIAKLALIFVGLYILLFLISPVMADTFALFIGKALKSLVSGILTGLG